MIQDKEQTETLQKEMPACQLEPTAPPPPSYEEVIAEDEKKRLEQAKSGPDAGENLLSEGCQGPWESKNLGELVIDHKDPKNVKRKRQRKAKKAIGWTFWIVCLPLAVLLNCTRDSPQDRDDPHDWNNDPLRPWNYRVNLDTTVH